MTQKITWTTDERADQKKGADDHLHRTWRLPIPPQSNRLFWTLKPSNLLMLAFNKVLGLIL
jgi:hypothetical protein